MSGPSERFDSFAHMNRALARITVGQRLAFEKLIMQQAAVATLFGRLRGLAGSRKTGWAFYPDCHWLPAGKSFRGKRAKADTVMVWSSIGSEAFYIWLSEDASYKAFFLDDDNPGVEPATFDELVARLREILNPSTGFVQPNGTVPDEPTFAARYREWVAATRDAGTRLGMDECA